MNCEVEMDTQSCQSGTRVILEPRNQERDLDTAEVSWSAWRPWDGKVTAEVTESIRRLKSAESSDPNSEAYRDLEGSLGIESEKPKCSSSNTDHLEHASVEAATLHYAMQQVNKTFAELETDIAASVVASKKRASELSEMMSDSYPVIRPELTQGAKNLSFCGPDKEQLVRVIGRSIDQIKADLEVSQYTSGMYYGAACQHKERIGNVPSPSPPGTPKKEPLDSIKTEPQSVSEMSETPAGTNNAPEALWDLAKMKIDVEQHGYNSDLYNQGTHSSYSWNGQPCTPELHREFCRQAKALCKRKYECKNALINVSKSLAAYKQVRETCISRTEMWSYEMTAKGTKELVRKLDDNPPLISSEDMAYIENLLKKGFSICAPTLLYAHLFADHAKEMEEVFEALLSVMQILWDCDRILTLKGNLKQHFKGLRQKSDRLSRLKFFRLTKK